MSEQYSWLHNTKTNTDHFAGGLDAHADVYFDLGLDDEPHSCISEVEWLDDGEDELLTRNGNYFLAKEQILAKWKSREEVKRHLIKIADDNIQKIDDVENKFFSRLYHICRSWPGISKKVLKQTIFKMNSYGIMNAIPRWGKLFTHEEILSLIEKLDEKQKIQISNWINFLPPDKLIEIFNKFTLKMKIQALSLKKIKPWPLPYKLTKQNLIKQVILDKEYDKTERLEMFEMIFDWPEMSIKKIESCIKKENLNISLNKFTSLINRFSYETIVYILENRLVRFKFYLIRTLESIKDENIKKAVFQHFFQILTEEELNKLALEDPGFFQKYLNQVVTKLTQNTLIFLIQRNRYYDLADKVVYKILDALELEHLFEQFVSNPVSFSRDQYEFARQKLQKNGFLKSLEEQLLPDTVQILIR